MILEPSGRVLKEISQVIGKTTNNVAEYSALIAGLSAAYKLGAKLLDIRMDSQLVVRQLRGQYRVRKPHIYPLYKEVKALLERFAGYTIQHVPREMNHHADTLCNRALDMAKE